MFKIFKAKINDWIVIILKVIFMPREQTCGECGRTFSSHDSGQKVCNDCHRMDEYIMTRSNRFCKNCLSWHINRSNKFSHLKKIKTSSYHMGSVLNLSFITHQYQLSSSPIIGITSKYLRNAFTIIFIRKQLIFNFRLCKKNLSISSQRVLNKSWKFGI